MKVSLPWSAPEVIEKLLNPVTAEPVYAALLLPAVTVIAIFPAVIDPDSLETVPSPKVFLAVTLKVYTVPPVSPVTE